MKKLIKENFHSENLYNKLMLLESSQIKEIFDGLKWTTENYKDAVIIGGTAVVHYLNKGRNLTPDIDFLVNDISDLKTKLDSHNIRYSPIIGDKGAIGITVEKFNTDFLSVNSGNAVVNKLILKTAKTTNVGGYNVKIASPELIAIMKFELGRDKDTDDGFALITSGILNKDLFSKIVNELKNYLSDYKSLVSYIELL